MREYLDFVRELAAASGKIIRKYYRTPIDVAEKTDHTPVTIADRESEILMREMIRARFPEHGILGEEMEIVQPEAEFTWVLDPIDGTKNFVSGTPLFGTLIALLRDGWPILGAINNPILNQLLVGDGDQAWINGEPARVRVCTAIEDATLLVTSHWNVSRHRNGPAFEALSRRARLYRSWGDCYGYSLVATGFADIMIDPAMHVWDVAALIPVVEGAGGVITDYYGGDPMSGEGAVATAGPLHDEVIRALNPPGLQPQS